MKPPTEKQAASVIVELLADLLDSPPRAIRLREAGPSTGYDYSISAPGRRFLVEYKNSASVGPLATAIFRLKHAGEADQGGNLPLIVVPFMGQVGRDLCEQSGLSWMDLSGNAKNDAPELRIQSKAAPIDTVTVAGRPTCSHPRVANPREFLLQPRHFQTQAELARQTGLDDGYVSKIVRRLEQEEFVEANDDGAVRPRDPKLLLDAWYDAYDFKRHRVLRGHVPARSGDELIEKIAKRFDKEKLVVCGDGSERGMALHQVCFVPACDCLYQLNANPVAAEGNRVFR